MDILAICPYSFGANTYVIFSGDHALAVDPATSVDAILRAVTSRGATLEGILLTHGHFDHVIALDTLRKATGVPAYVHARDAEMLTDGDKNASAHFFARPSVYTPAEIELRDGSIIPLGDERIRVLHTPGHTKGSVCYDCGNFLLTGDTLFATSIGRCDLWGGNEQEMRLSLEKLRALDGALTIYSGHGEPSTLSHALDNAAYYV